MAFTRMTPETIGATLVRRFVPLADKLRDLNTRFGLRPYEVHLVRTKWSGGERGLGEENVIADALVQPTPRVSDMSSIAQVIRLVGEMETGDIQVSEISGTYTEEQLRGVTNNAGELNAADEDFYWEIAFLHPNTTLPEKRRFHVGGAPVWQPGKLQWRVSLTRAQQARDRLGNP